MFKGIKGDHNMITDYSEPTNELRTSLTGGFKTHRPLFGNTGGYGSKNGNGSKATLYSSQVSRDKRFLGFKGNFSGTENIKKRKLMQNKKELLNHMGKFGVNDPVLARNILSHK